MLASAAPAGNGSSMASGSGTHKKAKKAKRHVKADRN